MGSWTGGDTWQRGKWASMTAVHKAKANRSDRQCRHNNNNNNFENRVIVAYRV
jgi:hypothetical protein